jgi:N-acetylmuramoyl-L-alanine amidase
MRSKFYPASTFAVAATLLTVLFSAQGSGAAAQDTVPQPAKADPPTMISQPVVQPLPTEAEPEASDEQDDDTSSAGATLAELVKAHAQTDELSADLRCLAGAIYF